MLTPHPESNLNLNIIVLGSDILRELRLKKEPVTIDVLMDYFITVDKKRTPDLLMQTLSFLYLFGFIKSKGFKITLNF